MKPASRLASTRSGGSGRIVYRKPPDENTVRGWLTLARQVNTSRRAVRSHAGVIRYSIPPPTSGDA